MNGLPESAVARLAASLVKPALPERYQPLEVVGRGGMGVVWRARDRLLERDVAVKVLAEHVHGDAFAARLQREARILARLEHPGIVTVHDSGVLDDGRAWYVMRLVRGDRLDEAAPRFASLGDALRVMLRLAETVAYAHARGVVHRDLKPRNVMLGPFGEVLVLDWGVARETGSGDRGPDPDPDTAAAASGGPATGAVTAHGTVLGTPGYMAPEQAAGLPADERSDIYGLGAVLRDLLAARAEPLPRPLRAIRDRALASNPIDRYADAQTFRADLECFQDGARVSAYREGPLDLIVRLARQHRAPLLLVAAYLAMRLAVLAWRGI